MSEVLMWAMNVFGNGGTGLVLNLHNAERPNLLRAFVVQGQVLESALTKNSKREAALNMPDAPLKCYGLAENIATDRLVTHGAALSKWQCSAKHRRVRIRLTAPQ